MTTSTRPTTRFHLSLNVRDLERSVAFYKDLLGLEPDKLHPRFARFTPDTPPLALSLVEQRQEPGSASPDPGRQRLSHLGFRVDAPEMLAAARDRLTRAGRELREAGRSRCCYALQDKFWVTDPDGNDWEFYLLLEDLETPGEDSKGCCD